MKDKILPTVKIHKDLKLVLESLYNKCRYKFTDLIQESESSEYGACTFSLDSQSIKYRAAKITPTKTGQFVTLWKRDKSGVTQPHSLKDDFDIYVISVRANNHFGHFVFPKSVLAKQGVLSTKQNEGKRGFRVYPPWDLVSNKQAHKTQLWQLDYFLQIDIRKPLDTKRADLLYFKSN